MRTYIHIFVWCALLVNCCTSRLSCLSEAALGYLDRYAEAVLILVSVARLHHSVRLVYSSANIDWLMSHWQTQHSHVNIVTQSISVRQQVSFRLRCYTVHAISSLNVVAFIALCIVGHEKCVPRPRVCVCAIVRDIVMWMMMKERFCQCQKSCADVCIYYLPILSCLWPVSCWRVCAGFYSLVCCCIVLSCTDYYCQSSTLLCKSQGLLMVCTHFVC